MNYNHLSFIKEIDKLKNVLRATTPYHSKRKENSAEHSWHLALSVITLAEEVNEEIDLLKCLKMALIHDLVEIEADDQIVYQEDPHKFERELEAAKNIFSFLNPNLGRELLDIWIEFEKKESKEAKFVSGIDRYLPLMSNIYSQGKASWKEHQVTKDMVYKVNESPIKEALPKLWEATKKEIDNHFNKD